MVKIQESIENKVLHTSKITRPKVDTGDVVNGATATSDTEEDAT